MERSSASGSTASPAKPITDTGSKLRAGLSILSAGLPDGTAPSDELEGKFSPASESADTPASWLSPSLGPPEG